MGKAGVAEMVEVRYPLRGPDGLVKMSVRGIAEAGELTLFVRRPDRPPPLNLTRENPHEYRLRTEGGRKSRL